MNPWILRIIIIILAVAFIPIIVTGTANLVTNGIQAAGQGIHSLLKPLCVSGEARLEGIIKLCLYFVIIVLLVRFVFGRSDRNQSNNGR